MAGKNFKINNPALSYFTNEASIEIENKIENVPEPKPQEKIEKPSQEIVIEVEAKKEKNPRQNPQNYAKNTYRTYHQETEAKETKSKRLNLLIQPSLAKDIGKIATIHQISSNELIIRALREYVDKQADDIKKYDKIFPHTK